MRLRGDDSQTRETLRPVEKDAGLNPFDIVQRQCDMCASLIDLDPNVLEIIRVPMQEVHVSIPVRMDDGSIKVFKGFRVIHNNALGPAKGGVRFHPDETIDTVRALAAWMTWKCSLAGLPLGGGKGGVVCNPKEMSRGELERLSKGYISKIAPFIGPDKDIPAPDVYTNPQIMAWMMDEYSKIMGKNQPGVITGKPLLLGGSAGRGDATARGGLYVLREAARVCGINLRGAAISVQGYGNAGYYTAYLAHKLFGSKIVAISDSKGAILNKEGLDPQQVYEYKIKTGSVANFPGSEAISHDELLGLEVDVLCLCALENVITQYNASNINAAVLAEFSNGPTTPEADEILYEKGIHVLPDFLCNAGGVTVSYFEMVQNFNLFFWDEEEVHSRLDKIMTSAYYTVLETSRKNKVNMRMAAYIVSLKRVTEAIKLRGWA
jgi:glutamate dehydrogenase (NAD(P)+)